MRPGPASSSLERLTGDCQYRRVCKQGRLARGDILWLYLLPASGRRIKLGLSISSKVIKKATARNKLKRTIKEWFRQNNPSTKGGYEAVVAVKKEIPITRGNLKEIREELSRLLLSVVT